jgi:hypothetical protein
VSRPLFTDLPHLHQLLKHNPEANKEFNQFLAKRGTETERLDKLQTALNELRVQNTFLTDQNEWQASLLEKQKAFIKTLGKQLEDGLQLHPLDFDNTDLGPEVTIRLDQLSVRKLLLLYWDVVADELERLAMKKNGSKP